MKSNSSENTGSSTDSPLKPEATLELKAKAFDYLCRLEHAVADYCPGLRGVEFLVLALDDSNHRARTYAEAVFAAMKHDGITVDNLLAAGGVTDCPTCTSAQPPGGSDESPAASLAAADQILMRVAPHLIHEARHDVAAIVRGDKADLLHICCELASAVESQSRVTEDPIGKPFVIAVTTYLPRGFLGRLRYALGRHTGADFQLPTTTPTFTR